MKKNKFFCLSEILTEIRISEHYQNHKDFEVIKNLEDF